MVTIESTRLFIPELEKNIEQFFLSKIKFAAAYGPLYEHLWSVAASRIAGGKYVRPRLFLSSFQALSNSEDCSTASSLQAENASRVATAIELLHYSFLLHDDVIDGDVTRRGRSNLIAELTELSPFAKISDSTASLERRKHWAKSCAILMGNLLLSEVHQIFADLKVSENPRKRLLKLLDLTITDSIVGEQLDIGLSDKVLVGELATVLRMCSLKTATYTFEFPLRAAAILANADRRIEPVLAELGQRLGLAFQLQDDLLSVFGDAKKHGKDPFSDLREGKETALIAHARMTPSWPHIEDLHGRSSLTDDECKRLRVLLEDCGAKRFTESLIGDQLRAFNELLVEHNLLIPEPLSIIISRLSSELEGRLV